jgi:hypothetical protein
MEEISIHNVKEVDVREDGLHIDENIVGDFRTITLMVSKSDCRHPTIITLFIEDEVKINGQPMQMGELKNAIEMYQRFKRGDITCFDKEGGQI